MAEKKPEKKDFSKNFSVGELFIMGFDGPQISSDTLQTIQQEKICQFILFAQNYQSKEQLIHLTDEIQSYSTSSPFLISVDQEGGRVQRFKEGFTILPPAKKVGEKNSAQLAFEVAQIQAKELFAAGIQLNFSPVCDINTNPANPVIGDRAYGSEESRVTEIVRAIVKGHLSQSVQPCIKHFPGHGDTHLDSHYALPTVDTALDILRKREWIPFQNAIREGCNFLMSAHLLLPHLDSEKPGTLSPTFLKHYLRGELQFKGIVVSDDMQMDAITKNYGEDEAPVLALAAGCDLLCYRSEAQTKKAIQAVKKAVFNKKLSEEALYESILRVRAIREKVRLAQDHLTLQQRLDLIGSATHQEFISKNFD